MTRRWSFRTRFVAAASACLLPLLAVVLFVLSQSLNNSRDQLQDTEIAISDVVAKGLAETLTDNQNVLSDLAANDQIRQMTASPDVKQTLNQLKNFRSSFYGVFLLDPQRGVVAYSGVDPTKLLPSFDHALANALNGVGTGVSNRIAVPEGNADADAIALVAPVWADPKNTTGGKPIGAIGGLLSIDRLERTFLPSSFTNADTAIALVAKGEIIAQQPSAAQGGAQLTDDLVGPIAAALDGKRGKSTYQDAQGGERLAVYAPVDYQGAKWAVVVTSASPTTYAPNRKLLEYGLIALAAAVVLTLVLAVLFGELTARPLRQLAEQAAAVTHVDLNQPIQPVGRGEVAALSAAFRDMADRLTTQVRDTESARGEVAAQAERLRELLRRTVRLQEDERRRIAGEIHDAVSPLITGALYQTRALRLANGRIDAESNGTGSANGVHYDEELSTVGDLLERAMEELHGVIFALRPPDLDDLGVVAAIERYVQQVNRTGLPCHLEVTGEPQRLSPEARLAIYRIVQEALHNALRHAHADEAVVRMEWLEDRLRITIRDNGSGFDPEQAAQPFSLGLLSMRERAAAVGATLDLASRPGTGTAIIIERPFDGDLVTEILSEPAAVDEPAPEPATEVAAGPVAPAEVGSV